MGRAYFKYLFELYISGNITEAQRNELFDYIRSNDADESLIALMDEHYARIRSEVPSSAFVSRHGDINLPGALPDTTLRPLQPRRYRGWAVAASLLLLVIAGTAYFLCKPGKPAVSAASVVGTAPANVLASTTTIRTGNKEQKLIVLADSTRILVNGATILRFPDTFSKDKRELYLEGEAYFDVQHAASWPFIIHTPAGITTVVLGTAFNIKAYPGRKQLIVSVVTGKVKVTKDTKALSVLENGQEMRWTTSSNKIEERQVTPVLVDSWQRGDINLVDETMADIIKDLQIFYGINIQLNNPSLSNLVLTIGFKKQTSVESALRILCELADARFDKTKDGYVVY